MSVEVEFGLCGFVQITRGLRARHLSRQASYESADKILTPGPSGMIRQIQAEHIFAELRYRSASPLDNFGFHSQLSYKTN